MAHVEASLPQSIVVTGGSGYLGQFLVDALAKDGHKIACLYWSTQPPELPGDVTPYAVNLATGSGLADCFDSIGTIDVVINCAAISSPAVCEQDPEAARAINIPTKLLDALESYQESSGKEPMLIQISTDQVYDGCRDSREKFLACQGEGDKRATSAAGHCKEGDGLRPIHLTGHWCEDDPTCPVNAYGQSKLDAETVIQERWPNHIILRSSLIYGPKPKGGIMRSLFIQFVASALESGKPTTFFQDEYRSAVYIDDIITTVRALLVQGRSSSTTTTTTTTTSTITTSTTTRACGEGGKVFNMGGPERLSRVDMAQRVAQAWGLDPKSIVAVPSASAQRNVASPADISMDMTRLQQDLGVRMTPMLEALLTFQP